LNLKKENGLIRRSERNAQRKKQKRGGKQIMTINRLLQQEKENYTNEVSLLVSILIRFPQVSSLNFDPHKHLLRFSFIVAEEISEESTRGFEQLLKTSLDAFHFLDETDDPHLEIIWRNVDAMTSIEINRRVDSLTQEEISLMVMLLQDAFSTIVMDVDVNIQDDELHLQEEIIDSMLLDVKTNLKDRNFIAYREEGRVMVFNK
jgi:hypothetical protein